MALNSEARFNSLLFYVALENKWMVRVKMWPDETSAAVLFEPETLEEFPSPTLIAQMMLVA